MNDSKDNSNIWILVDKKLQNNMIVGWAEKIRVKSIFP